MPEYKTLLYEKDKEGGFVVITLNRPASLNAMSQELVTELQHSLWEAIKDDEIKVLIFTGAPRPDGRPCFSAGRDLKESALIGGWQWPELKGTTGREVEERFPLNTPAGILWSNMPRMASIPWGQMIVWAPKISIAAVDGVCTAGGIELALSCDIILASQTALISDLHVKNLAVGIGGLVGSTMLAYRIGVARATELMLTGEPINGKQAYEWGLANHYYPPDKLLPEAKNLARKIAGMRPEAVQMTKLSCRIAQDMGYKDGYKYGEFLVAYQRFLPRAEQYGAGRWVRGEAGTTREGRVKKT